MFNPAAPLSCDLVCLAQAAPEINGAFVQHVVLRVLHISSAVILVGGIFYQRAVLAQGGPDACFAGRRQVWARWVGIATFLLLATGIFNFMNLLQSAKAAGTPLTPTYHALFGVKFLLALAIMFLAAVLAGKTKAAERFRQNMPKWLNLAWMASVAVLVIAALLRGLRG